MSPKAEQPVPYFPLPVAVAALGGHAATCVSVEAGTKPNLAKLTLARKLAATVLALWRKEEPYRPEIVRRSLEPDREA